MSLKERKERNDKICKLWTEGVRVSILCQRFALSDGYVREILKGAGIWTRSPG
jgi:hypothetical protein